MIRFNTILLIALVVLVSCTPEKKKKVKMKDTKEANVLFYNVENLFDTINNPNTNDDDFTPEGYKRWDTRRYFHKINNLSKVIENSFNEAPVFVGLAEIENEDVLDDLCENYALDKFNYNYCHVDSPDERGIDVGLLYREEYFQLENYEAISVHFETDFRDKTRDILHVEGTLMGEYIHIFVNHWPSRGEGKELSEPKRISAAETLKYQIDKVLKKDSEANIVVMGDFNDHPTDVSVKDYLKARAINDANADLYNLVYDLHKDGGGSYNHKGDWAMLDQFMVSKNFIDSDKGLTVNPESVLVYDAEWILFKHPKYKTVQPNKTYSGPKYHGGYSDHLPIKFTIEKK